MRSIVLLTILALAAPALADDSGDATEASEARDAKAEYAAVARLVDEWFAARDSDQQRALATVDEKLTWWYRRELDDHRRDGEEAALAAAAKKKKKRGGGADLDSAADMLDATAGKDYPRLRAVTQELADMQPRFDRMEANAVMYLDKARKLRELQALARAEIAVEPPPAPRVVDVEAAPEEKAAKAEDRGETAKVEATEQATETAKVPAVVEAPPKPAFEILDEVDEKQAKKEKKAKEKAAKKEKKVKDAAPAPVTPPSIEDLDD